MNPKKEREQMLRREAKSERMLAGFILFGILQMVAMYVALCNRGNGYVIAWMLLSFAPLALSIRTWWQLGKEEGWGL